MNGRCDNCGRPDRVLRFIEDPKRGVEAFVCVDDSDCNEPDATTDSTMRALVAAWEAWDQAPTNVSLAEARMAALRAFAAGHGMAPLEVRSEVTRMLRRRPRPTVAACLAAITAGVDR